MGKIWSAVLRPIKTFNIESRAERIISKDKPVPAPKYKVDVQTLQKILKDNPGIVEAHSKKHSTLDNRLKTVFVSSTNPEINPEMTKSTKSLPLDRNTHTEFEFGVQEPEFITPGRLSLKSIFAVINDYSHNHKSVESLSIEWNVKQETLAKVLKYNGVFELYIPNPNKGKKGLDPAYVQQMAHLKRVAGK